MDIYKRNDSSLLWIVVDLFVVRWTTRKTWKCLVCDLPREQLPYLKNQNKTSTELLP